MGRDHHPKTKINRLTGWIQTRGGFFRSFGRFLVHSHWFIHHLAFHGWSLAPDDRADGGRNNRTGARCSGDQIHHPPPPTRRRLGRHLSQHRSTLLPVRSRRSGSHACGDRPRFWAFMVGHGTRYLGIDGQPFPCMDGCALLIRYHRGHIVRNSGWICRSLVIPLVDHRFSTHILEILNVRYL